jgi:hypothetical protein
MVGKGKNRRKTANGFLNFSAASSILNPSKLKCVSTFYNVVLPKMSDNC